MLDILLLRPGQRQFALGGAQVPLLLCRLREVVSGTALGEGPLSDSFALVERSERTARLLPVVLLLSGHLEGLIGCHLERLIRFDPPRCGNSFTLPFVFDCVP